MMIDFEKIAQRVEIGFWKLFFWLVERSRLLRLSPMLILFSLCAALGIITAASAAGLTYLHNSDSTSPAFLKGDQPDIALTDSHHNTLLILVDRLGEGKPSLSGIWLSVALPSSLHIDLLPLYPGSFIVGAAEGDPLVNSFALDSKGSLAASFLQALQTKNIRWDDYLVVDRYALLNLADASLPPDQVQGNSILAGGGSSLINLSREATIRAQAITLREICSNLTQLLRFGDPQRIFSGMEGHYISAAPKEQMISVWEAVRRVGKGLTCEYPTLPDLSKVTNNP